MLDLGALEKCLKTEAAEGFLELLLNGMGMAFRLDPDFRRNIQGFSGRYLFSSRDRGFTVSAVFGNGSLVVADHPCDRPDVAITFRDEKALMGLLLAPRPDILGAVLRQDVVLAGNLNYLYKFAFMAKRLQLKATGQA